MIPYLSFVKENMPVHPFMQNGKVKKCVHPGFRMDTLSYRSEIDGVLCRISYIKDHGQPALRVKLTNNSPVPYQPQKAGLKLGIDTYMDKFPDWFGKYFPTLMRNEKTHFYGYLQTPSGHTLGLVSQQPVASWSVDYNLGYQIRPHFGLWGIASNH